MPEAFTAEALLDAYPILSAEERLEGFALLSANEAADFFLALSTHDQAGPAPGARPRAEPSLDAAARARRRGRPAPGDGPEERAAAPGACSTGRRAREVTALLAYAEDAAGGVMNPRYMRLRPEISVEVAIRYLRRQAIRGDRSDRLRLRARADMRLLGVVSFRELFAAPPERARERHHAHRPRHRHATRPTRKPWRICSPRTASWPSPSSTPRAG